MVCENLDAFALTPQGGRVEISLLLVEAGVGKRVEGEETSPSEPRSRESGVGKFEDKGENLATSHQPLATHYYAANIGLYASPLAASLLTTHSPGYAQIQIADTGKGISPDFLPYIFDYFRQESTATTRKFGGLGLGLAIVRNIVEMHGGNVTVASLGEGQGSTFTVKLPLLGKTEEAGTDVADASKFPTPDSRLPTPLSNVRVLVVEDETDSRDFVTFVLEEAGATVTAVSSAVAALEVLTSTPEDV